MEQGKDEIFRVEGLEYVAYENLRQGRENKEAAQGELDRIQEEEPDLQKEYDTAWFNLERATNNAEWIAADKAF